MEISTYTEYYETYFFSVKIFCKKFVLISATHRFLTRNNIHCVVMLIPPAAMARECNLLMELTHPGSAETERKTPGQPRRPPGTPRRNFRKTSPEIKELLWEIHPLRAIAQRANYGAIAQPLGLRCRRWTFSVANLKASSASGSLRSRIIECPARSRYMLVDTHHQVSGTVYI
jgi:hypothetical protein